QADGVARLLLGDRARSLAVAPLEVPAAFGVAVRVAGKEGGGRRRRDREAGQLERRQVGFGIADDLGRLDGDGLSFVVEADDVGVVVRDRDLGGSVGTEGYDVSSHTRWH